MRYTTFFFFFLLSFAAFCQLQGKVVGISDGDTFTLLTSSKKEIKVRLYGIDCPEGKQDFGNDAKKFLSDLVFNKEVKVIEKDMDRYGRTIGLVTIENSIVNEILLSEGMAWHYRKYDTNKRWDELEEQARTDKKGLWKDPNAVAPWTYRQSKRDVH